MADIVENINVVIEQDEVLLIELNEGLPGPPGPQGPKGDKGDKGEKGDTGPIGLTGSTTGSHLHVQDNAAFIWTIQHNLGFMPNVAVFDFDDNQIFGWKVFYESENVLLLRFPMLQSGVVNVS